MTRILPEDHKKDSADRPSIPTRISTSYEVIHVALHAVLYEVIHVALHAVLYEEVHAPRIVEAHQ